MGDTKISWAERSWNPVRGCTRVSEGCRNCYAETMAGRIVVMGRGKPTPYDGLVEIKPRRQLQVDANGEPTGKFRDHGTRAYWTGKVAFDAEVLAEPLRRRKPTTYFVNSMSDMFHDGFTNEQIAAVFGVMAATPQHTFIALTKRAERMREWFGWVTGFEVTSSGDGGGQTSAEACRDAAINILGRRSHGSLALLGYDMRWPLPNVILGVSVENQTAADERMPHLLATPAAVRLVSAEPLLGPVDLSRWVPWVFRRGIHPNPDGAPFRLPAEGGGPGISWVITGCESGAGARPCEVDWLRSLRNQCVEAQVPFFLKQAKEELLDDDREDPREVGYPPYGSTVPPPPVLMGPGSTRKPGGIIELPCLDGVQWAQRPEVRP